MKLKVICKRLKTYTDNYPNIFERECIRLYSSNLSLYEYIPSLISLSDDMLDEEGTRLVLEVEIHKDPLKWKGILEKFVFIRSEWSALTFPKSLTEPLNFLTLYDYILSILKGI